MDNQARPETLTDLLRLELKKQDDVIFAGLNAAEGLSEDQIRPTINKLISHKKKVYKNIVSPVHSGKDVKHILLEEIHNSILKCNSRAGEYYDLPFNKGKKYLSRLISRYEEDISKTGTGPTFHRGGPVFSNYADETIGRHSRWFLDPFDDDPSLIHQHTQPEILKGKTYHWCGPVVYHFGHFIADFCSRILGSSLDQEPSELLFYRKESSGDPEGWELQDWHKYIINYLNPSKKAIRIIDSSVICESLSICPQAEPFYGYPRTDYLDALSRIQPRPDSRRSGTVYVSRTRLHTGEKLAGEKYLEHCLAMAGVKIFHPQEHSVRQQLETYINAKKLIFIQGSAVHLLQLLGWEALEDVIIIPKGYGATPYERHLFPRCKKLDYIKVEGALLGPGEPPDTIYSSTIYRMLFADLLKIIQQLDGLSVQAGKYFNGNEAQRIIEQDRSKYQELIHKRFKGKAEFIEIRRHN